ncbi:MAG: hypothetical protein V1678_05215 [Candidatus Aenigmatarchaeota archaeon]
MNNKATAVSGVIPTAKQIRGRAQRLLPYLRECNFTEEEVKGIEEQLSLAMKPMLECMAILSGKRALSKWQNK